MSKPTVRVLALLEMLQAKGFLSGAELSQALGVDRRTIRRYIAALEELGIPITTEQGRFGGYRLVAGYKLPPLMFTDDEALVVSLGLMAVDSLGIGEIDVTLASAQAKLERVMPTALKRRVRAISESTSVQIPKAAKLHTSAALLVLSDAVQTGQRIRLDYQDREGQATERFFDPYGIVFRRGNWYMAGMCHLRKGMRTLRLDRVKKMDVLAARFQRPKNFNAVDYLNESFASLLHKYPVQLWLDTTLENAVQIVGEHNGMLTAQHDGVLFTSTTEDLYWFSRYLLHLPCEFKIISPVELKTVLQIIAEKLQRAAL